jgi:hypothetical protein
LGKNNISIFSSSPTTLDSSANITHSHIKTILKPLLIMLVLITLITVKAQQLLELVLSTLVKLIAQVAAACTAQTAQELLYGQPGTSGDQAFVACYVDDLVIASKDPQAIIEAFEANSNLSTFEEPRLVTFHVGCDFPPYIEHLVFPVYILNSSKICTFLRKL